MKLTIALAKCAFSKRFIWFSNKKTFRTKRVYRMVGFFKECTLKISYKSFVCNIEHHKNTCL